jgi:hypothetical protein
MSLSVCLVTRNEEAKLPRVLASVAGIADEVIVADTGSADRTAAVAEEHGAKVQAIAWDDDFAAACNSALERATGDWVLWLNPDEELMAVKPFLTALMEQADVLAYWVRVQELLQPTMPEPPVETMQLRLFRRRPELNYEGRLHAHFVPSVEDVAAGAGKKVARADVLIRRHAYLSVLTDDKRRWALRLLERELHDRPGGLPYLIERGRLLLELNDPRGHAVLAEAAEQVHALREEPRPPTPTVGRLLEYLLTVSPEQSRCRLTHDDAIALILRWFADSPPLLWTLAQQCYQRNEVRRAAGLLDRLVQLGRTGSYDRSAGFDPTIIGSAALMNLGSCYLRLGDSDRAEKCLKPLLDVPSQREQARQNLAVVEELRKARSGPTGSGPAL